MNSTLTIQAAKQGDDITAIALIVNGEIIRELPFTMSKNDINSVAMEVSGTKLMSEQFIEIENMAHEQAIRESHRIVKKLKEMPEGTVAELTGCGLWGWIHPTYPGKLITSPANPETQSAGNYYEDIDVLTPEEFEGNSHAILNEATEAFRAWLRDENKQVIQVDPERLRIIVN